MSGPRIEADGPGSFRVSGAVTLETVSELSGFGAAALSGQSDVVIDLGGIDHADSGAVALLLEWLRQGRECGTSIRFRGIPPQMRAIIDLSDLGQLLPLE